MSDCDQLAAALASAQASMGKAVFNRINPHFRSKYADLAAIADATLPALNAHGLAVTQMTKARDGALFLVTRLMHRSGQYIEGEWPLPNGTPQQMGSALTYARRYGWSSVVGITADDDDDANAAEVAHKANGKRKAEPLDDTPITKAQVDQLIALADEVGADKAKFCSHLKVPSIAEIPAYKFQQAQQALESKR